jgi:hypothetical protein
MGAVGAAAAGGGGGAAAASASSLAAPRVLVVMGSALLRLRRVGSPDCRLWSADTRPRAAGRVADGL